jgi:Na+/H+-translocating membrane pyrophosphatase
VELVARAGLREMIRPGVLAVMSPIIVGVFFKYVGIYREVELLGEKAENFYSNKNLKFFF